MLTWNVFTNCQLTCLYLRFLAVWTKDFITSFEHYHIWTTYQMCPVQTWLSITNSTTLCPLCKNQRIVFFETHFGVNKSENCTIQRYNIPTILVTVSLQGKQSRVTRQQRWHYHNKLMVQTLLLLPVLIAGGQ